MQPVQKSEPVGQPCARVVGAFVAPPFEFDTIDRGEHDRSPLAILAVDQDAVGFSQLLLHRGYESGDLRLDWID